MVEDQPLSVTCACNHLTNFAILMQVKKFDVCFRIFKFVHPLQCNTGYNIFELHLIIFSSWRLTTVFFLSRLTEYFSQAKKKPDSRVNFLRRLQKKKKKNALKDIRTEHH